MLKKISLYKVALSIVAGCLVFLSYPKFNLFPLILLFPAVFLKLEEACSSPKEALFYGFLTSVVITLGGFYWIVYVLHLLGGIPYLLSVLLFVGFWFISCLNFPIFLTIAVWFKNRLPSHYPVYDFLLLPSLFVCIEAAIPKLFPWALGHSFYNQTYLIQAANLLGVPFLSFSIFATGRCLYRAWEEKNRNWLFAALALWVFHGLYSCFVLWTPSPTRDFKVALIQPNIGSLDKLAAERGYHAKTESLLTQVVTGTEKILEQQPDLITWPEALLPFSFNPENPPIYKFILYKVREWNIPVLTGTMGRENNKDYNSAYLLKPDENPDATTDIPHYNKIKLLAFGEYMPLGDTFPFLYRWFPQVSHFAAGTQMGVFRLSSDLKFGVSICYEALFPFFIARLARHKLNLLINLTNDSWFGPTSEPYLHGAISTFRAVETQLPLVRVTNTGTSFTVDRFGKLSRFSPVYAPDERVETIRIPLEPPRTVFVRLGIYSLLFFFLPCMVGFSVIWWLGRPNPRFFERSL